MRTLELGAERLSIFSLRARDTRQVNVLLLHTPFFWAPLSTLSVKVSRTRNRRIVSGTAQASARDGSIKNDLKVYSRHTCHHVTTLEGGQSEFSVLLTYISGQLASPREARNPSRHALLYWTMPLFLGHQYKKWCGYLANKSTFWDGLSKREHKLKTPHTCISSDTGRMSPW